MLNGTTLWQIEQYLSRGWAVVPLHWVDERGQCSCNSIDPGHARKQGGKHPLWRRWPEHLVRDAASAARVWAEGGTHPAANVGIATGAPSGIWVLDIDPDNGGTAALSQLVAAFGGLPETYRVVTGSGGTHYYWQMPIDFEPTNRRGALPPGIDVRGSGGQVVAPPSVSAKGPYVELPSLGTIADAPAWLLELIRPVEYDPPTEPRGASELVAAQAGRLATYAAAAVSKACAELAALSTGRNDAAFAIACRLRELINAQWSRLNPNDVERVYYEAAAAASARGNHAFPWTEARQVWLSAARHVGDKAAELPEDRALPGGAVVTMPAAPLPFYPAPFVDPTRAADALTASGIGKLPKITDDFVMPATTVVPVPPSLNGQTAEYPLVIPAAYGGPAAPLEYAAQSAAAAAPVVDMATDPAAEMIARMLTARDLMALPPPQPLINGLLDLDSIAWLIGPPGAFKSFVALDWAIHVAQGADWYGHRVTQGGVVYVVAEGSRGMALRAGAWERHHERGIGDHLRFLPEPVQAASAASWSVLVEACARLAPRLVILDTQSRITIGLDENDNSQMMQFVSAADQIKRATGACVLTVHHSGRTGKDARGASSIDGAQDAELRLERPNQHGLSAMLHADKQKDQAQFEPIEIELARVAGAPPFDPVTGRDLSSLAVSAVIGSAAGETIDDIEATRNEAMGWLINLMRTTFAEGWGGTKAEIRSAFGERHAVDRVTFNRAWNKAGTIDAFRPFSSKRTHYRYVPPSQREGETDIALNPRYFDDLDGIVADWT